jgi:toxin ParE1/3/4
LRIILDVAKSNFREIKSYVESQLSETVWNELNQEFKATIADIRFYPEVGEVDEALHDLREENFGLRLVRQSRIVYEYDDKQVLVHMFVRTKRDFRTHIIKRILSI